MIGRVWVCAGSIMTDKSHRQGAITRCIHATECQAAVPWFTLITRLPQLLSHMSNLECTRPARTPTSICACVALLMSYILMYQRRPDAPALPRNAASRDSWSMMIFAFVLQREIDMLVVRAHDHMHMRMCSSAHQLHFAVSTTSRRARAVEKWPISQIFRFFPHLPYE